MIIDPWIVLAALSLAFTAGLCCGAIVHGRAEAAIDRALDSARSEPDDVPPAAA